MRGRCASARSRGRDRTWTYLRFTAKAPSTPSGSRPCLCARWRGRENGLPEVLSFQGIRAKVPSTPSDGVDGAGCQRRPMAGQLARTDLPTALCERETQARKPVSLCGAQVGGAVCGRVLPKSGATRFLAKPLDARHKFMSSNRIGGGRVSPRKHEFGKTLRFRRHAPQQGGRHAGRLAPGPGQKITCWPRVLAGKPGNAGSGSIRPA